MVGLLSLRGPPWRESFLRFLQYVLKPGPLPRFLMTMEGREERAHGPVHTVPGGISQAVGNAFPIFWEK